MRYYVEAESDREIADGPVPKTDDWRAEVDWADVIVFDDVWMGDDVGTGALARELQAEGHAVVGGTPNTDRLEGDRGYATDVLESRASVRSSTASSGTSARPSGTSGTTPRPTSSSPSGRSRTSSGCSTSAARTTAAT